MCNLYSMTATVDELRRMFGSFAGDTANLPAFGEIQPGKPAPVLRRGDDGAGLELELMEWGFTAQKWERINVASTRELRMQRFLILATFALGIASLSAPASARNYDCAKAGNANKTACKAPVATTVVSHKTTKVTTTKTTARNYDCTKAGNKNKAACKMTPGAAAAPVRTAGKATQTTTSASYDCTKFYNKMRAVCRAQSATTKTSTSTVTPAPTSKPIATRTRTATTVTRSVNSNAAGASAQCKDGSVSHSQHRTGACSHHGGVAKWL
jgi:hypothetical protein